MCCFRLGLSRGSVEFGYLLHEPADLDDVVEVDRANWFDFIEDVPE